MAGIGSTPAFFSPKLSYQAMCLHSTSQGWAGTLDAFFHDDSQPQFSYDSKINLDENRMRFAYV